MVASSGWWRQKAGVWEPYLGSLGVWPAVVLSLGFVWLENDFSGSAVPRYLALSYILITLHARTIFV